MRKLHGTNNRSRSTTRIRFLLSVAVCFFGLGLSQAFSADSHPLEPPNTSSPRDVLRSFLDLTDSIGHAAVEYREQPSRATELHAKALISRATRYFDLSSVPVTARREIGSEVVFLMWEVLSRIDLPPRDSIPDRTQMEDMNVNGAETRYRIPHTEITIARIEEGDLSGQYQFSQSTVDNIQLFYVKVKELPYVRNMIVDNPQNLNMTWGGWLLMPPKRAEALPTFLKRNLGGQAIWKWVAHIVLFLCVCTLVWLVHRFATKSTISSSLRFRLCRLAAPASFILIAPLMDYFWSFQIGVTGYGGRVHHVIVPVLLYTANAWLTWHIALFAAEAIISSPSISDRGLDAHLLRLVARIVGVAGVLVILFWGGNRLGLPLYGLMAGVGVGGLAIALATQGTLENFLGSLNLFADRPVRVGDFCKYGDKLGTVEEIGLRSTRVRGLDRTVTSVSNADFSKIQVTNYSRRDRMLFRPKIRLRIDTKTEQLHTLLKNIRKLLNDHPDVISDISEARFVGFGIQSLDLEILAYIATKDYKEFTRIQEGLYFSVLETIGEAGTSLAILPQYPSPESCVNTTSKNRSSAPDGTQS